MRSRFLGSYSAVCKVGAFWWAVNRRLYPAAEEGGYEGNRGEIQARWEEEVKKGKREEINRGRILPTDRTTASEFPK